MAILHIIKEKFSEIVFILTLGHSYFAANMKHSYFARANMKDSYFAKANMNHSYWSSDFLYIDPTALNPLNFTPRRHKYIFFLFLPKIET